MVCIAYEVVYKLVDYFIYVKARLKFYTSFKQGYNQFRFP